jgi:mono/diheme cytochrome c family protein
LVLLMASSSVVIASSRSQREQGAAVFAASGCLHCHSVHHVGGHRGPDLSGVGRRKKKAEMLRQITYGSKIMPAFGDSLSKPELDALIAYLRSCRDKQSQ